MIQQRLQVADVTGQRVCYCRRHCLKKSHLSPEIFRLNYLGSENS